MSNKTYLTKQEIVKEILEEAFNDIESEYDLYNRESQEVEHESYSGFQPFTNGGLEIIGYTNLWHMENSGEFLPCLYNKFNALVEEYRNEATKQFIEDNEEELKELGITKDQVNYSDLEEIDSNLANKFEEYEREYIGEDIMFKLASWFYEADNENSDIKGKPSVYIFLEINWEHPYFRRGRNCDFVIEKDIAITDNFKEDFENAVKEITDKLSLDESEQTENKQPESNIKDSIDRKPNYIDSIYDDESDNDRYTIFFSVEPFNQINPINGCKEVLGISEGGNAISMFAQAIEGDHLGKKIKWNDLSVETRKHIIARFED